MKASSRAVEGQLAGRTQQPRATRFYCATRSPLAAKSAASSAARVTLHNGEDLQLERAGDLGKGNGGMPIFVNGRDRPERVRWADVEAVDLDRPTAMYAFVYVMFLVGVRRR